MSEHDERPIPKDVAKYLKQDPGVLMGIAIPVIAWVIYAAVAFGGVRFSSSASGSSEAATVFWIALASIPIGLSYAAYSAYRWILLVREGIVVDGRIESFGAGHHNLTDVTVGYEVNGAKYQNSKSISNLLAEQWEAGQQVRVLVHPRIPKVYLIVEEAFPDLGMDDEQRKAKYHPDPELQTGAALEKYKNWWKTLLLGAAAVVFAVYEYVDLTAFEKTGGTKRMNEFSAILYGLLGKWGVVLVFGGLGLFVVWIGFDEWRKLNRARQKAAQSGTKPSA